MSDFKEVLRVDNWILVPHEDCWEVARVAPYSEKSKYWGKERKQSNSSTWHGDLPQALRRILDRCVAEQSREGVSGIVHVVEKYYSLLHEWATEANTAPSEAMAGVLVLPQRGER